MLGGSGMKVVRVMGGGRVGGMGWDRSIKRSY